MRSATLTYRGSTHSISDPDQLLRSMAQDIDDEQHLDLAHEAMDSVVSEMQSTWSSLDTKASQYLVGISLTAAFLFESTDAPGVIAQLLAVLTIVASLTAAACALRSLMVRTVLVPSTDDVLTPTTTFMTSRPSARRGRARVDYLRLSQHYLARKACYVQSCIPGLGEKSTWIEYAEKGFGLAIGLLAVSAIARL